MPLAAHTWRDAASILRTKSFTSDSRRKYRSRKRTSSLLGSQSVVLAEAIELPRPSEAMMVASPAKPKKQARCALIWSGKTREARGLLAQIRASRMAASELHLAEMRQACAEGHVADAKLLQARIDGEKALQKSWHAALIAGQSERVHAMLRPLDKPERLPHLMQFMVYPGFDVRQFPVLAAQLQAA